MQQFRFHIRSLTLLVALIAVVLFLRDRLNRRWYSCAALAAHHSQRARTLEWSFSDAKSLKKDELARQFLRMAGWHHEAAYRYREAAFCFWLPHPSYPMDGPTIEDEIKLESKYYSRAPIPVADPASQRTRPAVRNGSRGL